MTSVRIVAGTRGGTHACVSAAERGRSVWWFGAVALFVAHAALIAATFRDYGVTWDEGWHARYGDMILRWYRTGFRDSQVLTYGNRIHYGGFFDSIAQVLTRLLPFGEFETRHLSSSVFGLVAAVGTWRLGRHLGGERTGLLAALFLLMTPMFYGHSFNNPKDIPFAGVMIWAVYYIVRSIETMPTPPASLLIKLAAATGLALGIRIGAVLALAYFGLAFVLWLAVARRATPGAMTVGGAVRAFAPRFAAVCIGAYAVMLPWWPSAMVRPVRAPLEAIQTFGHFPWNYPVLFDGEQILASQLPRYYLLKWALISMPEFLLIGLVAFVVTSCVSLWRGRAVLSPEGRGVALGVIAFAALFPAAYASLTHAIVYDGWRHFLFVVPLLAVLAALGVSAMLSARRLVAIPAGVAVVAGLLLTGVEMVRLHPHQYIYFNDAVAGGLATAADSYETDYWGNSYREGTLWVVAHYRPAPGDTIRVASCSYPMSTAYYLTPGFVHVLRGQAPDIVLATTRWGCDREIPGTIVHVVEREGVPLLYVREVSERAPRFRRAETLTSAATSSRGGSAGRSGGSSAPGKR